METKQRVIKFRAWNGQQMIYSSAAGAYTKASDITNLGYVVNNYKILMEYTGLHDKHGKEIYEGDIICIPKEVMADFYYGFERKEPEPIFHVVKWHDKLGAWDVIRREDESLYEEIEVIGNIYENPDLLK